MGYNNSLELALEDSQRQHRALAISKAKEIMHFSSNINNEESWQHLLFMLMILLLHEMI